MLVADWVRHNLKFIYIFLQFLIHPFRVNGDTVKTKCTKAVIKKIMCEFQALWFNKKKRIEYNMNLNESTLDSLSDKLWFLIYDWIKSV